MKFEKFVFCNVFLNVKRLPLHIMSHVLMVYDMQKVRDINVVTIDKKSYLDFHSFCWVILPWKYHPLLLGDWSPAAEPQDSNMEVEPKKTSSIQLLIDFW